MADDGDADPWDFLAAKKKTPPTDDETRDGQQVVDSPESTTGDDGLAALAAIGTTARSSKRAHGEFRAEMTSVSLRQRAWPLALALALVSVAGFMTEAVAAAQIVSIGGAKALFVVYPLGGLGLLLLALLQFRFVDRHARLTVLRIATLLYALAFIVALAMLGAGLAPLIAVAIVYLMGDQLNFLVPLLIWSLAGDEFNVAEGRKIFGWIVAWTYGGQLLGLFIAAASPPVLGLADIPLPTLLVLDPLICIFVGLWLPRKLSGSFAARGSAKPEGLRAALGTAFDFINGVPVWRSFLWASILTFIGGMTVFLSFMVGEEDIIGTSAATLQMFFGGVMLGSLTICLLIQIFLAQRLQDRIGIPGVLLILPTATVLGGVLLSIGIVTHSLPFIAVGLAAWFIPRWSVDENARRAALALVPDERRTRVSFLVDLVPISLGLVIAGPIAAIAVMFGGLWAVPAVGAVVTLCAIPLALRVRRGWEESLLNWRLRRRKQNRSLILGDEE